MTFIIKAVELYFFSLPISLAALGLLSAAQASIRWLKSERIQVVAGADQPNQALT